MSTYVPSWVKRDQKRFPRVQVADGIERGDPLGVLARTRATPTRARSRAFMEHLKRVDGDAEHRAHGAGGERDRHVAHRARARRRGGQAVRAAPVPAELMRALAARGEKLEPELRDRWQKNGTKTSGTWAQVFGDDEWGAGSFHRLALRALRRGAREGRQEANTTLPMYVNAALNRTGRKPGEYPSGGPLPHLLDVWKAGAPSLDFLAPDIYFPNFAQLAARFNRADNMLFIPEANNATNPPGSGERVLSRSASSTRWASRRSRSSRWAMRRMRCRSRMRCSKQLTPLILENRGKGRIGVASARRSRKMAP